MNDPHNHPHRTHKLETLALPGWAISFDIDELESRHAQIVLHHGEQPGEVISCLHNDDPVNYDNWGFDPVDVLDMIKHVVYHLIHQIEPNSDD